MFKVDFGSHCLGLRCYESTGSQENTTDLQVQIVSQMIWQSAGDQFTVFAILYCFRYLEAFGSIWILTVFAILHCFARGSQRSFYDFQKHIRKDLMQENLGTSSFLAANKK